MMWILKQIVRLSSKEDGGTISAIALISMVYTKEALTHKASCGIHLVVSGIPWNTWRWNFDLIETQAQARNLRNWLDLPQIVLTKDVFESLETDQDLLILPHPLVLNYFNYQCRPNHAFFLQAFISRSFVLSEFSPPLTILILLYNNMSQICIISKQLAF